MTDRELKKRVKKLGIIFIIMIFLMIFLSVYTLSSTKAELSIYENTEYANNLQALGINEEEFKQYLAVFGNLVDNTTNENVKTLNMAINFIDEMCPSYEVQTNEAGQKCYDASIISKVITELNGEYRKEGMGIKNSNYTYEKESNQYIENEPIDKMTVCLQIDNITKNGEQIEVTYQFAIMTTEEMTKYKTGQEADLETSTVKAVILMNQDYEYAKYFVSSIEKI